MGQGVASGRLCSHLGEDNIFAFQPGEFAGDPRLTKDCRFVTAAKEDCECARETDM